MNDNKTIQTIPHVDRCGDAERSTDLIDDPIEKLQQKQSEVQIELNEVLEVAKNLENLKQKKTKSLRVNDDETPTLIPSETQDGVDNDDDDDDELLEFQQIENELKISDLNRQLNHIQEELRISLYKQLLKNTNNELSKNRQISDKTQDKENSIKVKQPSYSGNLPPIVTASHSSCSDSGISAGTTLTCSPPAQSSPLPNLLDTYDKSLRNNSSASLVTKSAIADSYTGHNNSSQEQIYSNSQKCSEFWFKIDDKGLLPSQQIVEDDTQLRLQNKIEPNQERVVDVNDLTCSLGQVKITDKGNMQTGQNGINCNSNGCSSGSKHPSLTGDLERIDEDEEYLHPDDPEKFRAIYEKKISPIYSNSSTNYNNGSAVRRRLFCLPRTFDNQEMYSSSSQNCMNYDSRLVLTNSSSSSLNRSATTEHNILNVIPNGSSHLEKLQNNFNPEDRKVCSIMQLDEGFSNSSRPLTLYMPRPNDDINLIEHVQALGHDLNIISNKLKLDAAIAQGYLWKKCSNKKWLSRYFYFDRKNKILSYYENESHLVKKQSAPRNTIPFDTILDVYVDHRMSNLNTPTRVTSIPSNAFNLSAPTGKPFYKAKGHNFIFVLATELRKYHLASSGPEIMRAWIDILYTAARANDYFYQFEQG